MASTSKGVQLLAIFAGAVPLVWTIVVTVPGWLDVSRGNSPFVLADAVIVALVYVAAFVVPWAGVHAIAWGVRGFRKDPEPPT